MPSKRLLTAGKGLVMADAHRYAVLEFVGSTVGKRDYMVSLDALGAAAQAAGAAIPREHPATEPGRLSARPAASGPLAPRPDGSVLRAVGGARDELAASQARSDGHHATTRDIVADLSDVRDCSTVATSGS